ncbi:MAG: right-handed parallel beta-helix repeat-containing protein [Planctomycetota bacterium]
MNRAWRSGWMAVSVVLASLLVALVSAVTIEIDEAGRVTVHDPDDRVKLIDDTAAADEAPPQDQSLEPATPEPMPFGFVAADGALSLELPPADAWPAEADVLVLAWSESRRAMVDGFALRFTAPPVSITATQLADLPAGAVELQALWRVNGETLVKATHAWFVPDHESDEDTLKLILRADAEADAGFTVWPLHPEARRIHVANAGDDANDGLTPESPVQTLARGLRIMRTGYGDQLLLRAGDTFEGGIGQWRWSGRDAQHPALLGVYGEGDRPRVVTYGEGFLTAPAHAKISFVAFQGLHVFPARRTPGHPLFDSDDLPYREGGLWWMARGEYITLDDCKIVGFQNNVVFQTNRIGELRNIAVRRCIIADSFSHWDGKIGGHSTGLFAMGVDGLLVQDSVFDHNGWAPRDAGIAGTKRTKFNHNLYLEQTSRNLTVRNNVITRGSSYGLQLRPGGEATGNLIARNAMGLYFAWHPSRIVGNVVVESVDQGDKPEDRRGYGIEAWPCQDGLIQGNLLLHKRGTAEWAGAIEVTDFGAWEAHVANPRVTIQNNTIVGWPVKWEKDAIVVRHKATDVHESGNVLDTESGGTQPPSFARPDMTLDEAAGGSFETWLESVRTRPRGTWPQAHTAQAIMAPLFAAYSMVDE